MNTGHPQRMNGTRPPTPRWLSLIPASIPRVLRERQRWMAWRPKPEPKSDGTWKWGKVPHNIRTGRPDDHTNPATWVAFDVAVSSLRLYTGIGYVLVDEDRIVGLDLDECRNPASGVIDESARALIRRVDSYTEISPSGHGIRIFAFGRLPPHGRKKGKLEMYTDRRFLTVTGRHVPDTAAEVMNREAVLLALHRETFHVEPTTPTVAGGGHDSHEAVQADGYTDDELVKLIRASSDKIRRLWNCQTSDYASPSEADLALIGRLVWQTGRRADRTDRLFRLSGLMRPKWDEPNGPGMTYGSRTIARAIAGCTTWWGSEGWIKRRRKSG